MIFRRDAAQALADTLAGMGNPHTLVVADTLTATLCVPALGLDAPVIAIERGDANKTPAALLQVWNALSASQATRQSVIVNVGGGVVTDLGGMAAATFKRGLRFINIPTTLLAAVDAAVGGKTGINLGGLKNEVGVFAPASEVIVSDRWLSTLDYSEIASGYAEMLKHAALDSAGQWHTLLSRAPALVGLADIEASLAVKERIVAADPCECGLRKALNLGHTAGHAFETLSHIKGSTLPHGYAVAYGMVTAFVLSHMLKGLPSAHIDALARYVRRHFTATSLGLPPGPMPQVDCADYPRLLELMRHDKKNRRAGEICFTLLAGIGEPQVDCPVAEADITAALDITRDLLGG